MPTSPSEFIPDHPRAVMVTRRADGGLQASPVRVQVDESGRLIISTRETTAKAKNLRRDGRVTLCAVDNGWSGPWMTIEGSTRLVSLPDALPMLADFYRQRDGSIPDDATFRANMEKEQRVIVIVNPERHTPA